MNRDLESRLAFCSWSTQPDSIETLIEHCHAIGVPRLHLALNPLLNHPQQWRDVDLKLANHGIALTAGMFEAVGEDYSTISRIHETGGVVPDHTWPQTRKNIEKLLPAAAELKLKIVTLHAGFIPEDRQHPAFAKVVERLGDVSDLAAPHGLSVALETGQESAPALLAALQAIGRPNLGVNFDPANMILYGSGDPIAALQLLMPHIRHIHIKDANASSNPGLDWGEEVVVGKGEVDWRAFFRVLDEQGYSGNFAIEREAGSQRVPDIVAARLFLSRTLRQKVWTL